ncbi:MAG: alpha/beta hydrolase [Candidatus Poseidoniales archaeon]|nr:MAG: alpha/beta hydrolase [Candidatus Poseidoniales archaeon]
MGLMKSLIFGSEEGNIEELKRRYGLPPSQFITLSNGVNVHLRDEGDSGAPPIVLLHGHSEDLYTWDQLVKHLIGSFRVIRFDLRRHGLTGPAPDNEYNIESYVSDLSMVIKHLEIDSFILVGHSMGGRISIKYTIANQEKVNGLILLSASGAPRKENTPQPMALKLMRNPLGRFLLKRIWSRNLAKKSLVDMVFDESSITDQEIDRMWEFSKYPGSMDAMFREFADTWEDFKPTEIGKIVTNSLLIWGEEDTICPESMGRWYDSQLTNSTMVGLPNIGHNPQFECPDKCFDEISAWISTLY